MSVLPISCNLPRPCDRRKTVKKHLQYKRYPSPLLLQNHKDSWEWWIRWVSSLLILHTCQNHLENYWAPRQCGHGQLLKMRHSWNWKKRSPCLAGTLHAADTPRSYVVETSSCQLRRNCSYLRTQSNPQEDVLYWALYHLPQTSYPFIDWTVIGPPDRLMY